MNSLPLISHHLFVAAVSGLDHAPTRSGGRGIFAREVRPEHLFPVWMAGHAIAIPLQVVADRQSLPLAETRVLSDPLLANV